MDIRRLRRQVGLLMLIWIGLVGWANSAEAPTGKAVLLFPVSVQGDFKPRSADEFTQALINSGRRMGSKAKLIAARPADLAGLHYGDSGRPPSLQDAARLCTAYGASHAVWLSMRFTPELTDGQPATLTVAVAARMWAYRLEDQKVILDEPIAVARSANTSGKPTDDDLKKLAAQLTSQCINGLAQQVVSLGRQGEAQSRVKGWTRPGSSPAASTPKTSQNYQLMVDALKKYQKSVDGEDLFGTTDSQRQALSAWTKLSAQEQQQIEATYPGTAQWMNGGGYYDVGTPYYPGYFRGGYRGGGRR